jgi:ribose 5-phosphate isomerase B
MRKIPKKKIKNILFVCYGNTCRSPMAEGLAKKTLGKKVNVESAGLSPSFDSASKEAVVVMEKEYDIDISSHRPRDIKEVSLGKFDFVIALDLLIHTSLLKHFKVESERLILWEINDPFSMSVEEFRKCAEKISRSIRETFK